MPRWSMPLRMKTRCFGVRSAMPTVRVERLCPGTVLVPPDFSRYVPYLVRSAKSSLGIPEIGSIPPSRQSKRRSSDSRRPSQVTCPTGRTSRSRFETYIQSEPRLAATPHISDPLAGTQVHVYGLPACVAIISGMAATAAAAISTRNTAPAIVCSFPLTYLPITFLSAAALRIG